MSEDFVTREMTLEEEINDLEKYNVPERIRSRMLNKLAEIESWNAQREECKKHELKFAIKRNQNLGAVVDALGEYLHSKQSLL